MPYVTLTRHDALRHETNGGIRINTDLIKAVNRAPHGSTIKLGTMDFIRVTETPQQVAIAIQQAKP